MSDTRYAIWSWRKKQWWGADHAGYTSHVSGAGLYSRQAASEIMFNELPGQNVAIDESLLKNHFSDIGDASVGEIIDSWRDF
jgi:hypothetical protein